MADALRQVKSYFGRDAVILSTRTYTKGGIFGLGGKPVVEITAAREMSDLPLSLSRGRLSNRQGKSVGAEGVAKKVPNAVIQPPIHSSDELLKEIGTLKSLVTTLVKDQQRVQFAHIPEKLIDTYQRLIETDVAEQLAQCLVERIQSNVPVDALGDEQAVRAELSAALEEILPTAGPIHSATPDRPTVIALVGPTGVGKTTTVAKLAANFCLRESKSVGLITIDTYRIAAVEQLKTYAQIIGVPLDIVMSPEQLRTSIDAMSDKDFILIDTAGRSQRDSIKIKELRRFFDEVRPDEVHLVLSSTCGEAVLTQAIENFKEVGIDRVIFTKLDEAVGFGVILSCLEKANARLSYLTTGQDVPDDIEVGCGHHLVDLILAPEMSKA